jgi:hypothetical protein
MRLAYEKGRARGQASQSGESAQSTDIKSRRGIEMHELEDRSVLQDEDDTQAFHRAEGSEQDLGIVDLGVEVVNLEGNVRLLAHWSGHRTVGLEPEILNPIRMIGRIGNEDPGFGHVDLTRLGLFGDHADMMESPHPGLLTRSYRRDEGRLAVSWIGDGMPVVEEKLSRYDQFLSRPPELP